MFRLPALPWTSFGGDKMTPDSVKIVTSKHRKSPSLESSKMQKLKRKRGDNSTTDTNSRGPPTKKLDQHAPAIVPRPSKPVLNPSSIPRTMPTESMPLQPPQPLTPAPTHDGDNQDEPSTTESTPAPRTEAQLEQLRNVIQSQMSLEILMKHNELRLIDQEVAKCQIALEQLRRCHEIPYPGTRYSVDVSNGVGPSLRPNTLIPPELPPPWGVTDGPYSRHYAKWLLPDPTFDGSNSYPTQNMGIPAGKLPTKGRSTRGSFADAAGKGRSGRGNPNAPMQSLPSGYPQRRDRGGPMIQRRKSDGIMVKLVCLDCRRDDFSSAQGFINHCRIAHARNFASHDAAADACGEPVEVDEAGAVINQEGQATGTAGLVHPLVRSAHLLKPSPSSSTTTTTNSSTTGSTAPTEKASSTDPIPEPLPEKSISKATPPAPTTTKKRKGRKAKEPTSIPSAFKPSPLLPHLSALMNIQGSTLDLADIVSDARTPVEFHESSSSEGEEEEEEQFTAPPATTGRVSIRGAGMQPIRTSMSPSLAERPGSRKGMDKNAKAQRLQTVTSNAHSRSASFTNGQEDSADHMLDVEPSPTNDSNQAPSLVSDDEEFENHSGSETSSSTSGSHGDLDVEVEDDESTSGGPSTRSSAEDSEFSGAAKDDHNEPTRKASAFRRGFGKREEKHVSFVSPSPVREVSKKRGGRRKKT